jgi:hypothetical protein
MRIPALLVVSLIGCTTASLPAAANDFEELKRAWTECIAKQSATDRRIIDCSKVIASTRTRDEQRAQAFMARGLARIQKNDRAGDCRTSTSRSASTPRPTLTSIAARC